MELDLVGFLFISVASFVMVFVTSMLGLSSLYQYVFWLLSFVSLFVWGYYWGEWWL